ncbi:unnamed protein product [Arabidopsis halleri]
MPDWSLLPDELLEIVCSIYCKTLNKCFDIVHARSVCRLWRSIFPFPSCLLRPRDFIPTFAYYPYLSRELCTLEKIPMFLFRVKTHATSTSKYFLGGIGRDESKDHMELLPSPIQCSVKVKIPRSDPTFIKMLDCQIIPLGHQYRMIGCNPKNYKGVAYLPLNKRGKFVVLLNYTKVLLVLRSRDKIWMRFNNISKASCDCLVAFRGRFYASFSNREIFVIHPYSMKVTPLMPLHHLYPDSHIYLVPSGNDELFLVERIIIPSNGVGVLDFSRFTCRVCRLDEEAGKWVVVSDLGDRVLFIGEFGNISCPAKELPDGCGVSGNSILFTNGPGNVSFFYKYRLHSENVKDDLSLLRFSRENRVIIRNKSPPVVALHVEH